MPIFQADLDHDRPRDRRDSEPVAIESAPPNLRRLSEESLPTDLCEGPIPDSPSKPEPSSQRSDDEAACSDRRELIERLKRGESPTWIPSRRVSHGFTSLLSKVLSLTACV